MPGRSAKLVVLRAYHSRSYLFSNSPVKCRLTKVVFPARGTYRRVREVHPSRNRNDLSLERLRCNPTCASISDKNQLKARTVIWGRLARKSLLTRKTTR